MVKDTVVVAVDPFAKDRIDMKKGVATVKYFSQALNTSLETVAVVSPDQVRWPSQFDGTWADQFTAAAEKSLKKVAKASGLGGEKSEVITQPMHSLKESSKALLDFAGKRKAKALAVFTHYRKAPHLRLFGSFASSVLTATKMPVLFVNAKGKTIRNFNKAIFSTDFSSESEAAFRKALLLFRHLETEVVIFHALTEISPEIYANVGLAGGFTNYDLYVRDEEKRVEKVGQRWVQIAESFGCKARTVIHHTNYGPAKSIIDAADRFKSDFIVACSKTKGLERAILGSVTRDLLEASKIPVLVIPVSSEEAETKSVPASRDRRDVKGESATSPAR